MAINLHSIEEEIIGKYGRSSITVGEIFYKTRQEKKLEIEAISKDLRIRKDYLKALESGKKEDLPDLCYVLGFVKAYAGALGLDPKEMVERYKAQEREESEGIEGEDASLTMGHQHPPERRPGWMMMAASAVGLCALLLVWYGLSGNSVPVEEEAIAQINETVSQPMMVSGTEEPAVVENEVVLTESAPEPVITQAAVATPVVEAAPAPAPVIEAPQVLAQAQIQAQIQAEATTPAAAVLPVSTKPQVMIRAKEETWVQIGDGKTLPVISKVMTAGETFSIPETDKELKLLTGNAGGLEILVNNQPVPALGEYGRVLRNVQLKADLLQSGQAVIN